jgi:hypothetical protein
VNDQVSDVAILESLEGDFNRGDSRVDIDLPPALSLRSLER